MWSECRVKAGVTSVVPMEVSSSAAVMAGITTCWNGPATILWTVFSSKVSRLRFHGVA